MNISLNTELTDKTDKTDKSSALLETKATTTATKKKKKSSDFLLCYQHLIENRQADPQKKQVFNKKSPSKKEAKETIDNTHTTQTSAIDVITQQKIQTANTTLPTETPASKKNTPHPFHLDRLAMSTTTSSAIIEKPTAQRSTITASHHNSTEKFNLLRLQKIQQKFSPTDLSYTLQATPTVITTTSSSGPIAILTTHSPLVQQLIPILHHHAQSGSQQITIHLEPKHLGSLNINIQLNQQKPTITIRTENSSTKEQLQQQLTSLTQALQQKLPKLSINILSTELQQQSAYYTNEGTKLDKSTKKNHKGDESLSKKSLISHYI